MHTQNPTIFTTSTAKLHNMQPCFMSLTLGSSSPQEHKSSTLIGDYIGEESCLDLKQNNDDDVFSSSSKNQETNNNNKGLRNQRYCITKRKEFPPPIPSLARTGNLPSRMPWVLKRFYTDDGRLILKEERVKHHEYFHAHRDNGRLTLQLIALDDEVYYPSSLDSSSVEEEEDAEKIEEENENWVVENCCSEEEEEEEKEEKVEEEDDEESCIDYYKNGISGNVSSPYKKCWDYNSVGTAGSTCNIFGVPLPAMRPVHS